MPIGKNAIKRVENNGYSKVKTTAPDMENSHVIANPDPQVTEKLIAPVEEATKAAATKKPAAKKSSASTAKKSTAKKVVETPAEAPVAKKPAAKKIAPKKEGFKRVDVGSDLPYYLL